MDFTPISKGSALPGAALSGGSVTTPQASLYPTDRPVAPPCRAFDTGLRPDPFPDRAASLLPGLLAATRTGLPPASDDELTTTDQPPTRSTSCLLGPREWLSAQPVETARRQTELTASSAKDKAASA